jgi:hypothetical protein
MPSKPDLLSTAESLKALLVARAVGDQSGTDQEYKSLRTLLLAAPSTKAKLPPFVATCRTLHEFWGFIQPKFPTYQERRLYLKGEFDPLLAMLEAGATSPGDDVAAEILTRLDWNEVQAAWRKALERKTSDPEGAITMARTLLETVCKHVLDEAAVSYDPKADLPNLYGLTAKRLRLSPSQHTEDVFKQILGGCHSVVQGLGTLRSRVGDAHGQGKKAVKPAARHAELAVNLAGAMATFLAQTWETVKADGDQARSDASP